MLINRNNKRQHSPGDEQDSFSEDNSSYDDDTGSDCDYESESDDDNDDTIENESHPKSEDMWCGKV